MATYANAIGPFKTLVVPVKDGVPGEPTPLVAQAHAAGLAVHIWTLRPENAFLPAGLKKAPTTDGTVRGDSVAEITACLPACGHRRLLHRRLGGGPCGRVGGGKPGQVDRGGGAARGAQARAGSLPPVPRISSHRIIFTTVLIAARA